jgi:hypothetical protein
MGRILLFLTLCLLSGCYSYPPCDYGYRQPYPAGYWADYGLQSYAPYEGEPNYRGSDRPGYATSVPEDGQPTHLTPPLAQGQRPQG